MKRLIALTVTLVLLVTLSAEAQVATQICSGPICVSIPAPAPTPTTATTTSTAKPIDEPQLWSGIAVPIVIGVAATVTVIAIVKHFKKKHD